MSTRSIIDCVSGSSVLINRLDVDSNTFKRLSDLGIFPGAIVKVLSNEGGEMILAVGEARLALDRRLASNVHIA